MTLLRVGLAELWSAFGRSALKVSQTRGIGLGLFYHLGWVISSATGYSVLFIGKMIACLAERNT